jgi:hypothetical protein
MIAGPHPIIGSRGLFIHQNGVIVDGFLNLIPRSTHHFSDNEFIDSDGFLAIINVKIKHHMTVGVIVNLYGTLVFGGFHSFTMD